MSRVIGIDLGTTNSVAACIEEGRAIVIPDEEGGHLTPSVVALTEQGRWLVGQAAKRQASTNPQQTIASIKRQMGSTFKVRLGSREFTPQEISSLILSKIKTYCESYLGGRIEDAVITVPAYFNDSQRQATKDAGTIAGLNVIRIISEPTAAALAYGLDNQDIHHILVWDLGGGTFDVSILELGCGMFEVKAVGGNTWLGGDDWDRRIVDYVAEQFKSDHGADLRSNPVAMQRLTEAAEEAKRNLSVGHVTSIRLPGIFGNGRHNKDLDMSLTRQKLEELTQDLLRQMIPPTRQALDDAGLNPRDLDRVVMVGGATRMPAVRQLCREILGKEPYTDIDPDEVVAIGAAIQAGVLTGELGKITLLDVTPLSLGIETRAGIFARIIERNTKIPTSASQVFSTVYDNQSQVDVHVLQGEREMACHNASLGRFELPDIPPAPRGVPRIEVCFTIDANGILQVSAKDLYTENENQLRIRSSRLSPEEMKRMIDEAKTLAEQDKARREEAETSIKADNLVQAAEEMITEGSNGLRKQELSMLSEKVTEVREALACTDPVLVKSRIQELHDILESYSAPA
ncbi:MAG: molecular chaperone DnaK [Chloroflexi bacterium]|nr:molecular chaperone DnaK [Chloroflexota bacterium]